MNAPRKLKRVWLVNPLNPAEVLGSGEVAWSTADGNYAVRADDTGVTEVYPSDMVVFDDDLGLLSGMRKVCA